MGIISYWGYDLTSSTSLPTPEEEVVKDTTKDSAPVELEGKAKPVDSSTGTDAVTSPFTRGSLTISGKGKQLYYVYDASGQKQLGYKSTGGTIELFPGTYQVILNNTRQSVTVQANRQTVIESGSLVMSGDAKDLYYVYDASGEKQLGYKSTGGTIELFPGTYQVEFLGKRLPVQVKAKEKTTL